MARSSRPRRACPRAPWSRTPRTVSALPSADGRSAASRGPPASALRARRTSLSGGRRDHHDRRRPGRTLAADAAARDERRLLAALPPIGHLAVHGRRRRDEGESHRSAGGHRARAAALPAGLAAAPGRYRRPLRRAARRCPRSAAALGLLALHAWHLYIVRIRHREFGMDRDTVSERLADTLDRHPPRRPSSGLRAGRLPERAGLEGSAWPSCCCSPQEIFLEFAVPAAPGSTDFDGDPAAAALRPVCGTSRLNPQREVEETIEMEVQGPRRDVSDAGIPVHRRSRNSSSA